MSTTDVEALSNDDLRAELEKSGVNAGPIGPSTRKIYELKLMKLRSNVSNAEVVVEQLVDVRRSVTPDRVVAANGSRNGSPAYTNGNSSLRTQQQPVPSKLLNSVTVSSAEENGSSGADQDENAFDETHEDDDDEGEVSFRMLTPEEAAHFRSNFSLLRENAVSGPTSDGVRAENSKAKTVFTALALLVLVAFALFIIVRINWEYNFEDDIVKDEL